MASNVTGSASTARGAALSRWAVSRAAVAALVGSAAAAHAQSDTGGSAGAAEAPDPNAEAPPAAREPGGVADFPKTLTPEQASPDNLQGWLRQRNRQHPALLARPALPPSPAPSAEAAVEAPAAPESAIEGYKRRLRSFDEHGVTVLSNRHTAPENAPVRAAAALAVPAPAPATAEPEPERPSFTETRSLRANQPKPQRVVSEPGLDWPVFALPVAAISLALIWLRKRRAAE